MPQAVITGASSGIGAALARRLCAEGYDLVLVARRAERLSALAEELRAAHGREVEPLGLDVTDPEAPARLLEAAPRPDVLVNNAGMGRFGPVLDAESGEHLRSIRLNCEALTALTLAVLPGMIERRSGTIVNVGSIAGLQPVPYYAVYGATKAFVHSFSEALDAELEGKGVRVVAIAPGPVPTEFQQNAGSPDASSHGSHVTPEHVAGVIHRAIVRPKILVFPAPFHWWQTFIQRFLPRRFVARFAARKMRKRIE